MAVIIFGALIGSVPTEGDFLAPPFIIANISIGLFFGGIALWIPSKTPPFIKSGIFLVALVSLATVCNWTAFAPEVTYSSSTTIGPYQISGGDQVGGRVVFGAFAIIVDLFIISMVIGWIRPSSRKES